MPRHALSADASDSDDAPESFSLSQSKKNAKEKSQVLKNFEASEKAKKKIQNRERDRKLKERALVTRHLGQTPAKITEASGSEEESDGEDEAVARMRRAMREAGEEMDGISDGDEGSEGYKGGDDGDDVWSGFDGGDQDEEDSDEDAEDDEDGDESMSDGDRSDENEEEDAMMLTIPTKSSQNTKSNPKYLQDDLFASAFSAQSKSRKVISKVTPKTPSTSQKQDVLKRRRRKRQPPVKDLIIGSRTIRTLAKVSDPRAMATAKTLPPHTVNKFVNRSLNLKGKGNFTKSRGWERRPANIGVLKSDGAPVGFVRHLV